MNNDNTVSFGELCLQIQPVNWKTRLARCAVHVCDHLDGRLSLRYGPRVLGWYDALSGELLEPVAWKKAKLMGQITCSSSGRIDLSPRESFRHTLRSFTCVRAVA